jgi:putative ABC transport system substrate-binding protein
MRKTFKTRTAAVFSVDPSSVFQKWPRIPKSLRFFAFILTAILCAVELANAQPAKVWKVGVLVSTTQVLDADRAEALRHGLRDYGYEEGKTSPLEYRYADGKLDRLSAARTGAGRAEVDVIVVGGTSVAVAAKNATSTIPIVVAGAGDLVEAGLIRSYMNPAVMSPAWDVCPPTFSATG